MLQNSLIEIGSKANVVLRFKSETTINGVTYAANEPYLFLKDINVIINYTNEDKVGNTDVNVIATSNIKPRRVIMSGISFSRKIVSLLACYQNSGESYYSTEFVTATADRGESDLVGTVFLPRALKQGESFFVYDSDFDKIENSVYDPETNSISNALFTDNNEYLISFYTTKIGTKFDLNKPNLAYMSLEIQGVGNIDKVTKNILMYFDKVSLNSVIQFTFIQNDMINVPLIFHIIDDKNNYVVFED
jgi:hypothetical protein